MSGTVRLIAVGDVHPNDEAPEQIFENVLPILTEGDIRFCQLECTISELGEVRTDVRNPAHRVHPQNIKALTSAGFDVVSFASNNALDYGASAFLDTIERLRDAGISVVGVGKTLAEARSPVILERKGVRIGFVSACSILRDGYAATPTRPGIAPLYVRTFYEPLENIYEQPGTPARTWTFADPDDVEAVMASISRAKKEADVVIACFHWGIHFTYDLAMYQPEVAYAAIDSGADLVLGTHPHCLQAFDVYRGKVIAYSLGNFVFEQDPISVAGVNEYLSFYGIPVDYDTPRMPHPKHTKLTGVLVCDLDAGGISRVAFRPTVIGLDAKPRLVKPDEPEYRQISQLLSRLCGDIGTRIVEEEGQLVVTPEKHPPVDTRLLLRRRKISYPYLRELSHKVE